MKLSISNLAWTERDDDVVYRAMEENGFHYLEISPTRVLGENPYDQVKKARQWADELFDAHGLTISSMQSIWHGRTESIFGSEVERAALLDYTKKAVEFSLAIGCSNLVLGCPRNRMRPEKADESIAVDFIHRLGDLAKETKLAIAVEAVPELYYTNYLNRTIDVLSFVENAQHGSIMVNLDIGTMLYYHEPAIVISGKVHLIHHVHISEPSLAPIQERSAFHDEIMRILTAEQYAGCVSIEMGKQDDYRVIERALHYVSTLWRV